MNRSTTTLLCILAPASVFAVFPEAPGDAADTIFKYQGYQGVDVGTDLILTAKHLGYTDGLSFEIPGFGSYGTYTVTNVVNDPNADLTLMTVDHALPGYYQINTSNVVAAQAPITMVGYGATGTPNGANNGYVTDTGAPSERRAAQNNVDFDASVSLGSGQPSFTALISVFKSMGEAALGSGDSGGGWYIDNGGVEQLVGINSFIATVGTGSDYKIGDYAGNPNANYFCSGAVELRDQQAWLNANGVATVPEPTSWAAIGVGCLGLGLLRRRSATRG